jgi:hypothetical protein
VTWHNVHLAFAQEEAKDIAKGDAGEMYDNVTALMMITAGMEL